MTNNKTIIWDSVRDEILSVPEVKAEYDALTAEFELARTIITLEAKGRKLRSHYNQNNSQKTDFTGISEMSGNGYLLDTNAIANSLTSLKQQLIWLIFYCRE